MKYRELFAQDNDTVRVRFNLSMEKIGAIGQKENVQAPFDQYFEKVSGFIVMVEELYEAVEEGRYRALLLPELEEWNQWLYGDILPEHYEESYANPAYAAAVLGEEIGPMLAYVYAEIRGQIAFAMESRLTEITILNELFAKFE